MDKQKIALEVLQKRAQAIKLKAEADRLLYQALEEARSAEEMTDLLMREIERKEVA